MKKNQKKFVIIGAVTVLLIGISIAFLGIVQNLNITFKATSQQPSTWKVGFKGSSAIGQANATSASCGTATVTASTVTLGSITLDKPNDKCTYELIISNTGDIPAKLEEMAPTQPTNTSCETLSGNLMECGNIIYKLSTDINGTLLTTGHEIDGGVDKKVYLTIAYVSDTTNAEIITQSNAKFTLTYAENLQATERR